MTVRTGDGRVKLKAAERREGWNLENIY